MKAWYIHPNPEGNFSSDLIFEELRKVKFITSFETLTKNNKKEIHLRAITTIEMPYKYKVIVWLYMKYFQLFRCTIKEKKNSMDSFSLCAFSLRREKLRKIDRPEATQPSSTIPICTANMIFISSDLDSLTSLINSVFIFLLSLFKFPLWNIETFPRKGGGSRVQNSKESKLSFLWKTFSIFEF